MIGPTFETSVLDNGLRVVSANLPHARSVALSVGFGVGSAHEREEEAGWAHLLEHLQLSSDAVLERSRERTHLLKSFGANFNASTEAEVTSYTLHVASRHWQAASKLLCEALSRPLLAADSIAVERMVVEAEASLRAADPFALFSWNTLAHLFAGTPFARSDGRLSYGTSETLGAATPERLAAWRERGYSASRAWVIGCGAIDHTELSEWAATLELPGGEGIEVPGSEAWVPSVDTHLVLPSHDQTHLALSWPTFGLSDPRSVHMMLISAWLGGGPGSRLYEEIRGRRGIAYTLFTDHLQYSAVGALQFVMQTPESARADEAVQVATQIISGEEDNLSESEFALLKQEIIGQLDLSSDNAFHLMNLATSHLASYGYVRQLDDIVTRIEAVDLAELRATWHEFLRPELVCLSRLN